MPRADFFFEVKVWKKIILLLLFFFSLLFTVQDLLCVSGFLCSCIPNILSAIALRCLTWGTKKNRKRRKKRKRRRKKRKSLKEGALICSTLIFVWVTSARIWMEVTRAQNSTAGGTTSAPSVPSAWRLSAGTAPKYIP